MTGKILATTYRRAVNLYYHHSQSINEVAFIIHKQLKDTVLGYKAVVAIVKIKAQPAFSKVPNRELLIILGDFNAKIGELKADSHLRSVVGQYGTEV
ncbi:hypothetical protein HUJ04_011336 [Dendroctonus ponderosae]|nr:hypothetical protein HUJ04_011336 [Dendroctonus ponderosae]